MNLAQYLETHGLPIYAMAKAVGVSSVAAGRYVAGGRFPRPAILAAIEAWTGGEVTASDMVKHHLDTVAKQRASARAKKAAATRAERKAQTEPKAA